MFSIEISGHPRKSRQATVLFVLKYVQYLSLLKKSLLKMWSNSVRLVLKKVFLQKLTAVAREILYYISVNSQSSNSKNNAFNLNKILY